MKLPTKFQPYQNLFDPLKHVLTNFDKSASLTLSSLFVSNISLVYICATFHKKLGQKTYIVSYQPLQNPVPNSLINIIGSKLQLCDCFTQNFKAEDEFLEVGTLIHQISLSISPQSHHQISPLGRTQQSIVFRTLDFNCTINKIRKVISI